MYSVHIECGFLIIDDEFTNLRCTVSQQINNLFVFKIIVLIRVDSYSYRNRLACVFLFLVLTSFYSFFFSQSCVFRAVIIKFLA